MTLGIVCAIMSVAYGIVCGGVYTWISPRRRGSWRVMWRSTALFTLLGAVMAAVLYLVFR